jgi:hypothetical protein
MEKGADLSLFAAGPEDQYETSDFPLSELDLPEGALAALSAAGSDTFLQIIDMERPDFLGIEGIGEAEADRLVEVIDELTVVEEPASPDSEEEAGEGGGDAGSEAAAAEAQEGTSAPDEDENEVPAKEASVVEAADAGEPEDGEEREG